jgi:AcrR family transcriptional regulator
MKRGRNRPPASRAPGRKALIQAGLKLFAEHGFAGTSIRDLAARAGVSQGLVRNHFGSKDGLRDAVNAHALDSVRGMYEAVLEQRTPTSLDTLTSIPVAWVAGNRDVVMYMRTALAEAARGSQALFDELLKVMRHFVEVCDERRLLQPGVDHDMAALYLLYDFIAPALLAPYAKKAFGKPMYAQPMSARRNAMTSRLFTRGIFK